MRGEAGGRGEDGEGGREGGGGGAKIHTYLRARLHAYAGSTIAMTDRCLGAQ